MNQFAKFISNINPLNIPNGTYSLDARAFRYSLLGAVLVITGVVLKNTFEQLKIPNHILGKVVGMTSFVLGWMIIAYSTATATRVNPIKTFLSFATAAGIVFAVMQMKKYMADGVSPPIIYPIMFAASWLLLGYTMGMGWGGSWNSHTTMGVLAGIMVLISMMGVLPWQRKKSVIDGPGLPLFVGAWVLITFANSMK